MPHTYPTTNILSYIDVILSSLVSIVFVCFHMSTLFAAAAVFLILLGLGWAIILVLFLVDNTADTTQLMRTHLVTTVVNIQR